MSELQFVIGLFGIAGAFSIGLKLGDAANNIYWRNEAVKEGKAEYYLDENNERKWRWK